MKLTQKPSKKLWIVGRQISKSAFKMVYNFTMISLILSRTHHNYLFLLGFKNKIKKYSDLEKIYGCKQKSSR